MGLISKRNAKIRDLNEAFNKARTGKWISISEEGYLSIQRNNAGGILNTLDINTRQFIPKYTEQFCPHSGRNCGDWCPMFHDPEYSGGFDGYGEQYTRPNGSITLCNNSIRFDFCQDFRETQPS